MRIDRLLVVILATLLIVLGQQFLLYDSETKRTPLGPVGFVLGLGSILGLIVAALRCALNPPSEPLGLGERGRQLYVYAAELLLFFLFIHLRLNVPEMFGGILAQYWTFLVLVIAFAAVGLGELFAGRGLRVLAEPLVRTGVVLLTVS